MNQDINSFINQFVINGKDLERDRKELISEATKKGIDIDELEIYIENKLASRQKTDRLAICPKCGAPKEDLSLICANCGFVFKTEHNDDESDNLHISTLIANINRSIIGIQSLPKINAFTSIYNSIHYALFLLSMYSLMLYYRSSYLEYSEVFVVFFFICFLTAIIILIRTKRYNLSSYKNTYINRFIFLKSEYEQYERQVRMFYGMNKEARNLLDICQKEIQTIIKKRKKNILIANITYILIFVSAALFYFYIPDNEEVIHKNKTNFVSNYGDILSKELNILPYYDSVGSQGLNKYIRLQNISVSANFDIIQNKYDKICESLLYTLIAPNGLVFKVNKVKISSSGLAYNDNENVADIYLTLRLLDKDRKEIAEMMPIKDETKSLSYLLNNASGNIYVDFTSNILENLDLNTINNILNNTVYFSINLENK